MFESKAKIEVWAECGDDYYYGKNGEKVDCDMAAHFYEKAMKKKHPHATYMLGLCYELGRGVEQDEAYAETLFEKAAEYGDPGAKKRLKDGRAGVADKAPAKTSVEKEPVSDLLGGDTGEIPIITDEMLFTQTKQAAEVGDAQAQYKLAQMYGGGKGVTRDNEAAYEWVKRAAEQGHAGAKKELRVYRTALQMNHMNERRAEEQEREREAILQQAATLHEASRYEEAARLLEQVAWQEEETPSVAAAACFLGTMYVSAQGVSQDYDAAEKLLRKAVAMGNKNGQETLDTIPEMRAEDKIRRAYKLWQNGDSVQARKLFEGIVEEDISNDRIGDAARSLCMMYASGDGVPQNTPKAAYWDIIAKEHGNHDVVEHL